jgi:recombination protein RecA
VIEKRGAFYSFSGTRLGQGRENARTFLRENPTMLDDIEKAIRSKAGLNGADGAALVKKDAKAELEDEDEDVEEDEDEEDDE